MWKKTHKFLLLSGYLNFRLTGEYKDSVANQVGYIPFNYRKLGWANRFSWKWKVLNVNRDMMPDLVEVGSILGYVTASAAKDLGVKARDRIIERYTITKNINSLEKVYMDLKDNFKN